MNVLNPKLTIFFAYLPQFVRPASRGSLLRMIELSAVFMLLTFLVFAVYGVFAAGVREQLISPPRIITWTRRTFSAGSVLLAGRLTTSER